MTIVIIYIYKKLEMKFKKAKKKNMILRNQVRGFSNC